MGGDENLIPIIMLPLVPQSAASTKPIVTGTSTGLYALMDTAGGVLTSESYYRALNANAVLFRPENGDVRVLSTIDPTATQGVLLKSGVMYAFSVVDLARLNFIRTSGDVTCSVQIGRVAQGEAAFAAAADSLSLSLDEFPAASAASDNYANPTTTDIKSFGMLWDGSNWDRAPGNSTDGAFVSNPDGTDIASTRVTEVAGTADAAGEFAVTAIDVSGYKTISMQTTGTYNLVQAFECSNDNITYVACPMQNVASVPLAENTSVTGAGNGLYVCAVNFKWFRNRVSAWTSGTINTSLVLTALPHTPPTMPVWCGQDTSPWVCGGNKTNNNAAPGATNIGVLGRVATAAAPTHTEGNQVAGSVNLSGHQRVAPSPYPDAATPLNGFSGNVANANAVATLAAAASKTTYITGFEITAAGATAGAVVVVTVVGTITGTLSYIFTVPAGAVLAAAPLIVEFPYPIPASGLNTAIVVTCPALGVGNTNAAAVAHGFQL